MTVNSLSSANLDYYSGDALELMVGNRTDDKE